MNLSKKKAIDFYLGGLLIASLKPCVVFLGRVLRRDHSLQPQGEILFIKMLGGGSLAIAFPMLLGIRRRHPEARLTLVTTSAVRPFAEVLGVFDRIHVIEDGSLLRLAISSTKTLLHSMRADTVVDLEVYSRLTTVFSVLTRARNRIGFYLEAVFWRRNLHTHLVFFNRFSGVHHFYEQIGGLLGAGPASRGECEAAIRKRLPAPGSARELPRISIGHACSDLSRERMLSESQWEAVFAARATRPAEFVFLGGPGDRVFADRIIARVQAQVLSRAPGSVFRNECGNLRLPASIAVLAESDEFWGIDSALLHFARLLGRKCVSYWGPTSPTTLLKPFEDRPRSLDETFYSKIACSPCVHVAEEPPCEGDNVCIQRLFGGKREAPAWLVSSVKPETPGSAPAPSGSAVPSP